MNKKIIIACILGAAVCRCRAEDILIKPRADASPGKSSTVAVHTVELYALIETSSSMRRSHESIMKFIVEADKELRKHSKVLHVYYMLTKDIDRQSRAMVPYTAESLKAALRANRGTNTSFVNVFDAMRTIIQNVRRTDRHRPSRDRIIARLLHPVFSNGYYGTLISEDARRIIVAFCSADSFSDLAAAEKSAQALQDSQTTLHLVMLGKSDKRVRTAFDKIARAGGGSVHPAVDAKDAIEEFSTQPDWEKWLRLKN